MASVHPIMDALREKRIKRGMTLSKLARGGKPKPRVD